MAINPKTFIKPGERKYLRGRNKVRGSLVLPSGAKIIGEDGASVYNVLKSSPYVKVSKASDVVIQNIDFVISLDSKSTTNRSIIYIEDANNVYIEGCNFYIMFYGENYSGATPEIGIEIYNSHNVVIENCNFQNLYHAVYSRNISGRNYGLTIRNCRVENNDINLKSHNLIYLYNTDDIVIENVKVSGAGLYYLNNTQYPGFLGTWGNGIYLFNADRVRVKDVVSVNNFWSGIVIGQNSKNVLCESSFFSYNTSTQNPPTTTASWVEMPGCEKVIFKGNILFGGLSLGGTDNIGSNAANLIIVSDNLIQSPSYGIDVDMGLKQGIITNNIILCTQSDYGVEKKGIYLWDKSPNQFDRIGLIVSNNIVKGFSVGIYINRPGAVGTVEGLTITGNRVIDCATDQQTGTEYALAVGGTIQFSQTNRVVIGSNSFNKYWKFFGLQDTRNEEVPIS